MEPVPSPRPVTDSAVGSWTSKNWTTDGKPPVCLVYYNVHGAIWSDIDKGLPPPQKGTYGIDLQIFSTIGNKYIESFTGIIKKMKDHPEFNGKGIDRCFLSMLRRVSKNVAISSDGEPDVIFNAVTDEAKNMYQAADIHFDSDDFKFVLNPDTPHYFQLYQNVEEVVRKKPKGRKSMPLRAAAGDLVPSTLNDYGVWMFYTNVTLLKFLSLEMISDTKLQAESINKDQEGHSVKPDNLFLPSELTNSINMVSRRNNKPIGAVYWISAIQNIGPMNKEGEDAKTRAIVAIGNLWKTRVTTLHEILSIFAPFHQKGVELGLKPLELKMLSTTCRVLRSGFSFPRTDQPLEEDAMWSSQEFQPKGPIPSPSPSPPPTQDSLWRRLYRFITKVPPELPDTINNAVNEAIKDDSPVDTSPQTQLPLDKPLKRARSPSPSPSSSRSRSPSRSRARAHSVPPSRTKRGGAKRKNSNHTRRLRLRTRTRH